MSVFLLAMISAASSEPNRKAAGGSQPQSSDQKKGAANYKEAEHVDPSQYVGADTCKTCHEEVAASYDKGPHWKTTLAKHEGPEWQGCEACHGPGKAHAESADPDKIIRFPKLSSEESSKRCLSCHQFGEEHANFLRSEHLKNNVGCVDCHSIHHAKVDRKLLRAAQPQLCYTCHLEVKPDFSKPFHHRVNEGLISCTNCHNPHGGFLTHQLRATAAQDVLCFSCHTDKAGPFAFEHGPVKTEGCVACHQPHGSSNPRLLRRSQVNLLCLECHTFTVDSAAPAIPSFHNQAQKYQACTLCHTAVHGSNTNRFLFQP
ncbi:MAG TPA: DmsE family decaheme c-type cytochrome [Candidatus Angelobacter sp.]|nr:DmsE family decaheme c-type cytochrome [Candidatus Angelobacter sp.]